MKNKNNLNLILIIGIFIVIGCNCPKPNNTTSSFTTPTPVSSPANSVSKPDAAPTQKTETSSGVTMENFNRLKTGMKYDEVVKILGSEGEVLSENDIAGTKTIMYQWKGASIMSNMNAMFQNGKLMSKSQFGLK